MKLKALMISMLIIVSCSQKRSEKGIEINEYFIKRIHEQMIIYMTAEGGEVPDMDILIDEGYFEFPGEDRYIVTIDKNEIEFKNPYQNVISIYNLNTQEFEHIQE